MAHKRGEKTVPALRASGGHVTQPAEPVALDFRRIAPIIRTIERIYWLRMFQRC